MNIDHSIVTAITALSEDYHSSSEGFDLLVNGISVIFRLIVWAVVGFVISKKAKEIGLNQAAHFCLCFFLGVIGTVISLILIDKRKKELYNQTRFMNGMQYQNPYGQQYGQDPYGQKAQDPYGQQQYGQGYGQQNANPYGQPQQQPYVQPSYAQRSCPSCGHTQAIGAFCEVCGSKIG